MLSTLGPPVSCEGSKWSYVAGPVTGPEETFVFLFASSVVVDIEDTMVGCREF